MAAYRSPWAEMSASDILAVPGRARVRKLSGRPTGEVGDPARRPVMRNLVEFARFDAPNKRDPLVGGERERSNLRVLRVTNKHGVRGLSDLDTSCGTAVAALLPLWRFVDVHLEPDLPSRR